VVVSHDRYLIERVCDSTVALLGDGSLAALPGGVDEYLARRAAATTPSEKAGPRKADPRAARRELTRLERRIASLETREAELHAELAQHATDYEQLSALDAELRQVVAQREAAEQAWLDLAEG
jgi:ABC transport system ATP-binding/permease protein